jgi:hypothetical protein
MNKTAKQCRLSIVFFFKRAGKEEEQKGEEKRLLLNECMFAQRTMTD